MRAEPGRARGDEIFRADTAHHLEEKSLEPTLPPPGGGSRWADTETFFLYKKKIRNKILTISVVIHIAVRGRPRTRECRPSASGTPPSHGRAERILPRWGARRAARCVALPGAHPFCRLVLHEVHPPTTLAPPPSLLLSPHSPRRSPPPPPPPPCARTHTTPHCHHRYSRHQGTANAAGGD